jgi:hypothetical protein
MSNLLSKKFSVVFNSLSINLTCSKKASTFSKFNNCSLRLFKLSNVSFLGKKLFLSLADSNSIIRFLKTSICFVINSLSLSLVLSESSLAVSSSFLNYGLKLISFTESYISNLTVGNNSADLVSVSLAL